MSCGRQTAWVLIAIIFLGRGPVAAQDSKEFPSPSAGKAIQDATKAAAQDHIAEDAKSHANPANAEKGPHDSCNLAPPTDETSSFNINTRSYVGGVRFGPYLHDLCAKVNSILRAALKGVDHAQHASGKIAIQFAVKQDGSISGLSVIESSGDAILDQIALSAVARAAPFDPLPMKFRGEFVQLRLLFFCNPSKDQLK